MDDATAPTCLATERLGFPAVEGSGDILPAISSAAYGHDHSAWRNFVAGGSAAVEEPAAITGPIDEGPEPALDAGPRTDAAGEEAAPLRIVEALLFAADTPLSAARLAELVGAGTPTEVRLHIAELNAKYERAGSSFRVEEIARGYQMMTLPAYRPWLAKLDRQRSRSRLSDAALEALAIVAYRQPIIRAEIEAVRGVACGDVLSRLREMGLIRIVGRAEVVGRPLLYGTTRKFLDTFGLAGLAELPPLEALTLRRPASAMLAAAALPDDPPPAVRQAAGA